MKPDQTSGLTRGSDPQRIHRKIPSKKKTDVVLKGCIPLSFGYVGIMLDGAGISYNIIYNII